MFVRIPPRAAGLVLSAIAIITVATDFLLLNRIWFGPAYLLIIALSAWLVGFRFALGLGLGVISANAIGGSAHNAYPYGNAPFLNYAVKFGCILVIAFMLARARGALEREWRFARTDPLTGALNRQAFFEVMKGQAAQSGCAVLIFADADGLKQLNDVLGHEAGDAALRTFADRIRGSIRKSDVFARIGGDEFVIFLRVKDQDSASIVANRLNTAVNSGVAARSALLRCSFGVLFLANGSTAIDAELRLADKLMYSAKKTRSGFLLASATSGVDLTTDVSALEIALPVNRKSVVRQAKESEAPRGGLSEPAPTAISQDIMSVT